MTTSASEYLQRILPENSLKLDQYDPEFWNIFSNFAFDEVVNLRLPSGEAPLDESTRFLAILATLLGCQGVDAFTMMLPAALNAGLTPIAVKETLYQAVAYLGLGRVLSFFDAVNAEFIRRGIQLPMEDRATVDRKSRRNAGNQIQIDVFGEGLRESWNAGPEEKRHMNLWLADNCFGDYYTRNGLTLQQREMITFCFLSAQGGCEPQLIAHAKGNMTVGNDKVFLIQVVSQCMPYIGYPRTLNALNCIDRAAQQ